MCVCGGGGGGGGTSSSYLFNSLTDISEGRSNATGELSLLLFDVFKFRPTEDAYVTPSFASFLSVCVVFCFDNLLRLLLNSFVVFLSL